MDTLKSIFAWLGKFLEKTRIVFLNIGTALVLIFLTIGFFSLWSVGPAPIDKEGKVVILDPSFLVVDEESFSSEFPIFSENVDQITFREFDYLIEKLKSDNEIAAILLDFSSTGYAGPTTAINVAEKLKTLKDSGKEIIAFSTYFDTTTLMMAAYADEIWAHSGGAFTINGVGGYRQYSKQLYENLKFTVHDFSQGDFKSAAESLTQTQMSDEDRKQRSDILIPIWNKFKAIISEGRNIDMQTIQNFADSNFTISNQATFENLSFAKDNGLIDGYKSFPEFRSYMIEKFGEDQTADRLTYPNISFIEFMETYDIETSSNTNKIAVVTVEGSIMRGEIEPGIAGADGIARLIRKAHENSNVNAIVMRVNSGGGTVLGSEIIRDELLEAKKKGLPIVVSMGDVAASGGVYIATPADYIFAQSTTITGSIGVAYAFPTLENTFEYIGINTDGVTTSKYAGWDISQPIDDAHAKLINADAAKTYRRFVDLVSESRDKTSDYVFSIASGRVWTGTKALELGLIDQIGQINDAIEKAAELSDLDMYEVRYYKKEISPEQQLIIDILDQFNVNLGVKSKYIDIIPFFEILSRTISEFEPTPLYNCTSCDVKIN
tara:strand:+ start:4608 stop:6425 length:1818 start_codon:yes stop_codon:yes gene_type:complete